MLRFFKRMFPITASAAGRLGNQVKRERARAKVRRKCDAMRAAMGMEPARWPNMENG